MESIFLTSNGDLNFLVFILAVIITAVLMDDNNPLL